jgi:glycolate oxidase
MNKILEVDKDNFTATVEPGVVLGRLHEAVERQGLYYPPYPGEVTATIGGNVATNAGGMRAVKYGVTRNFLLGLEAVLPNGDVIETGGRFIKSSTGYDLTQLIAGSEGTLAVVTRVVLKLIPPPGKRNVVLAPFNSLEDAINTVPDILRRNTLPMGIEFIEKDVVQLTEQFRGQETAIHNFEASLMIIVEAEGEDGATSAANDIGNTCLDHGAIDVFVAGGERATDLLAFREKAWPAIVHSGHADMADVVVPRSRVAEFVQRARQASRDLGITTFIVGHAGDGNVHVAPIIPEGPDAGTRMTAFFRRVFELGVSMGGTISGEHGIGYTKKPFIDIALAGPKLELMRRIKDAFDPNNIMNPGKIFDM